MREGRVIQHIHRSWGARVVRRLPLLLAATLVVAAVAHAAGSTTTTSFSNSSAITISTDCCAPTPAGTYPVQVDGSALTGTVTNVTATIKGLTHTAASDLDILLAAPGGQAVLLMSDSGVSVSGDITFSDAGATMPTAAPVGTGTYKPSNGAEDCTGAGDAFPSPAPGSFGTTMASLNGVPASGTWSLYVVDDCEVDSGSLTGVDLTITTTGTGGAPSTSAAVSIGDCCTATAAGLYPSNITVNGLVGPITGVAVTLNGVTHTDASDLNVLLVGPGGQKVVLMSDAGDSASNANLTFSDAAGSPVPAGTVPTGAYTPTNNAEDCATGSANDAFPATAPAGPYGNSLDTAFNGTMANGTWSLYVADDCAPDTGQLAGGWTIDFAGPTGVTVKALSATRAAKGVTIRWRTARETSLLGFNVYRASGTRFTKVNKHLVAAKRRAAGVAYSFVDRTARRGVAYRYRLQIVGLDGTKAFRGTVKVKPR